MLRFAITDRRLAIPSATNPETVLAARCAAVAASGVDYLLIREKDLDAGQLVTLSRAIILAVHAANPATKILIAQRPDVALALNADGVHLSAAPGELTPAQVRRILPSAFVGLSCHTLAEIAKACEQNASAILFGPIFGKTVNGVEVTPGIGLEALHEACAIAGDIPVFALGGITSADIPACEAAGASGIAAIRLFFASHPELPDQQIVASPD